MKNSTKKVLGGAGVAAATGAALAGAYYFYGADKATTHRKQLKSWAKAAEKEVIKKAKQVKTAAMSDANIRSVISEVAKRYEGMKDIDEKDVRDFVGTMQKGFQEARKALKKSAPKAKKAVKKVVAKAKKKKA